MTEKKSPRVAIPADADDLSVLHMQLCESKIARESITSILHERGHLHGVLVGRADYISAMNEFLNRSGLTPEAINPRASRKQYDITAATKRLNDERIAAQLREMRSGPLK